MMIFNMFKIIIFFICLISYTYVSSQQKDEDYSSKKVLTMVIVINGEADEYLYPLFIKYKSGQPNDTLKGFYIPGRIEFNLSEFIEFIKVQSDSIIMEFDSYQQLNKSSELIPYKYSFTYYQHDFNADCQVYQIERMCIKDFRDKYFKKSYKHKGGYVVTYNIGQTSIPVLNYVTVRD